ncbi:transposase [Salidesulfovibrio onnuriiensis]|uniref:transposase n=1 Tax=Salidesulfovibrio onnuriiensis TaxID=2583823 RepID=UPI0011CC1503|nr:transposase [Salidesulfovibrio onnuriiensis]
MNKGQREALHTGKAFEVLLSNESLARDYLLSICWPEGEAVCPRCRTQKIYNLKGDRFRCASCRYTFRRFAGRWLDNGAVSCTQWLALVRLFLARKTVCQAVAELDLSYNTVFKAFTTIRFAILAHAPDSAQLLGPQTRLDSYFKGPRLTGGPTTMHMDTIPVYGVIDKGNWVFIDLLPSFRAETLFHFHLNFHLRLVRTGHLVYSDPYKEYDTLLLCGNETLPYACIRRDSDQPAAIDASDSRFWPYALEELKRFRGISCQRFPLYLKELEFRFNHRKADIFSLVLAHLCDFVTSPS